jgi:hypothetical protein
MEILFLIRPPVIAKAEILGKYAQIEFPAKQNGIVESQTINIEIVDCFRKRQTFFYKKQVIGEQRVQG